MSKRQELRDRRKKRDMRNRIVIIGLVVIAAIVITLIMVNSIRATQANLNATQTAANVAIPQITPRTFNAKVDGVHLGDPNAPVKVDVFEDFRCSACLYYTQNFEPTVFKNYVETGKVYYTFKTFVTIDGHDGTDASMRSANAAMCAAEQNKFWAYHDELYANQVTEDASLFTDDRLNKMAQAVGLDMTKFNQCYSAKKYSQQVQNDINEAQSLQLSGTPSIVVNGKVVQNLNSVTDLTSAIDAALAGK